MRVLVYGAGGPAGINVCRSLAEAGHEVVGADSDDAHLPWVSVYGEAVHMPQLSVDAVNDLGVDAAHSQAEQGVQWLADHGDKLDAKTLCPSGRVVALSQDKWEACLQFRRAQLRRDMVHLIQDPSGVTEAADDLGYPFWMRARHGAGARGSALCENFVQADSWAQYWWARDPKYDFIAEAYLPGRDLAWTSLWHDGELVASFGRERLEYIYPKLAPSGRTGTPTIAKTIHDQLLNEVAVRTVMALDERPNGFYSVDFREDEFGYPCPTEVNAGRCFTTSYLSTAAGVNFMDLWCRMLNDKLYFEPINKLIDRIYDCLPAGLTWMRHIDCPELLLDAEGKVLHGGSPLTWVAG